MRRGGTLSVAQVYEILSQNAGPYRNGLDCF
jgi:hypothetical protein